MVVVVHVQLELAQVGEPFVAVETDQANLDRALERTRFLHVRGDATDETVLVRAGIERARGVVSTLSNDKDNLFVTVTARQLNPDLRIISRAIDSGLRDRLLRAGADGVVCPSQIGGLRMASELIRPLFWSSAVATSLTSRVLLRT